MILVDFSHLFYRNALANKKNVILNYNLAAHQILSNLTYVTKKFEDHHDIVLACDWQRKDTWRYKWFDDNKHTVITNDNNEYENLVYKGHRTKDDSLDWDKLFEIITDIEEYLRDYSDMTVLRVPECEADDIIGVIATEMGKKGKVIIYSSDKDFKQLLNNNVSQYDPIKNKMITLTESEAKDFLTIQCITGDKVDGILSIVPRAGEKSKKSLKVFETLPQVLAENPYAEMRYSFNNHLINLGLIPDYIKERILEEYGKDQRNYNQIELMEICLKYGLSDISTRLSAFHFVNVPSQTRNVFFGT